MNIDKMIQGVTLLLEAESKHMTHRNAKERDAYTLLKQAMAEEGIVGNVRLVPNGILHSHFAHLPEHEWFVLSGLIHRGDDMLSLCNLTASRKSDELIETEMDIVGEAIAALFQPTFFDSRMVRECGRAAIMAMRGMGRK